jgi:hypothetical protein
MLFGANSEHDKNKKDQTGYGPPNAAPISLKAVDQDKPNTQPNTNPSNEVVNGNGNEVPNLYTENLILAFLYGAGLTGILALLLPLHHARSVTE